MRRLTELVAALTFLTQLPVARLTRSQPWPAEAESVWAYPLAGTVVGAGGGAALWAAERVGIASPIAAVIAVATMLALGGGLHEDGLADTADGFGGGRTRERKLAIMRDSSIGSFGALALVLAVATRIAALMSLHPADAVSALVVSSGLGRGAIVLTLLLLRPAREDGVAASLRRVRPGTAAAALGLAALPALLASSPGSVIAAAAASAGMAWLSRRQVGGYTGDTLGATSVAAECAVLAVLSASR